MIRGRIEQRRERERDEERLEMGFKLLGRERKCAMEAGLLSSALIRTFLVSISNLGIATENRASREMSLNRVRKRPLCPRGQSMDYAPK